MSLVDVQRELFRRYAGGDYRGGLELLDEHAGPLDVLWTKAAWWRACLLARLGEVHAALDVLEAAVHAGAWWSETTFDREDDLASLRGSDRFARLVSVCEERRGRFTSGHPGLAVDIPDGDGPFRPLVVLHGRAETFEIAVGCWAPPVVAAGWAAVLPESSLRDSVDGPVWDEPDRAARELDLHVASLAVEPRLALDRCALAGYSQGGRRALQLALEMSPRFPSVLTLNPTVLRAADVADVLSSLGDPPHPAVSIITGDRDPAYEGQMMLADALQDEGLAVDVDVIPGMGHYYPPDFDARLRWALAHLPV